MPKTHRTTLLSAFVFVLMPTLAHGQKDQSLPPLFQTNMHDGNNRSRKLGVQDWSDIQGIHKQALVFYLTGNFYMARDRYRMLESLVSQQLGPDYWFTKDVRAERKVLEELCRWPEEKQRLLREYSSLLLKSTTVNADKRESIIYLTDAAIIGKELGLESSPLYIDSLVTNAIYRYEIFSDLERSMWYLNRAKELCVKLYGSASHRTIYLSAQTGVLRSREPEYTGWYEPIAEGWNTVQQMVTENPDDPYLLDIMRAIGLSLAFNLRVFGRAQEAKAVCNVLLEAIDSCDGLSESRKKALRLDVLTEAAWSLWASGEQAAARVKLDEAAELLGESSAEQLTSKEQLDCAYAIGLLYAEYGEVDRVRMHLKICEELNPPWEGRRRADRVVQLLARLALLEGRYKQAQEQLDACLMREEVACGMLHPLLLDLLPWCVRANEKLGIHQRASILKERINSIKSRLEEETRSPN